MTDEIWRTLPGTALISPEMDEAARFLEMEFPKAQQKSWVLAERLVVDQKLSDSEKKKLHEALCTVNNLTFGKWTGTEQNLVREYFSVLEREASYQDSTPMPDDKRELTDPLYNDK
jgi:hypothetical protein